MRAARRSLIEFAVPASSAIVEPLRPARPVSAQPRLHAVQRNTEPPETDSRPKQPAVPSGDTGAAKTERSISARGGIAADMYVKAFDAMSANLSASLDYARRLADVTSPAEFVKLSTSQTRKQIELMIAQTAAFGALSRSLIARKSRPNGVGGAKAAKKKVSPRH